MADEGAVGGVTDEVLEDEQSRTVETAIRLLEVALEAGPLRGPIALFASAIVADTFAPDPEPDAPDGEVAG